MRTTCIPMMFSRLKVINSFATLFLFQFDNIPYSFLFMYVYIPKVFVFSTEIRPTTVMWWFFVILCRIFYELFRIFYFQFLLKYCNARSWPEQFVLFDTIIILFHFFFSIKMFQSKTPNGLRVFVRFLLPVVLSRSKRSFALEQRIIRKT